jgi:serine/threonine protein kinase
MEKLKASVEFETALNLYTATHLLGEGGAGRVYAATDPDGEAVAIKVLDAGRATTDKRKRFKNETAFLARQKHVNLVRVTDHGVISSKSVNGPFYVMERFEGSLRDLLAGGISPQSAIDLFSQVLHGVEAAHLMGAVHRDLKPENILWRGKPAALAIADFGVARFAGEDLFTEVETAHGARLANFEYAAPEQRRRGGAVGVPADIYALGLILNQLFTNEVPHGTSYKTAGSVDAAFAYVDPVVEEMIRQDPLARPKSIEEVKRRLRLGHEQQMIAQRLAANRQDVVKANEIEDSFAVEPPKVVDADWNNGTLTLTLDKAPPPLWVQILQFRLGNFSSYMGLEPPRFMFRGVEVTVGVEGRNAQSAIDSFKSWLPIATQRYRHELEAQERKRQQDEREGLARERAALEARAQVVGSLKI